MPPKATKTIMSEGSLAAASLGRAMTAAVGGSSGGGYASGCVFIVGVGPVVHVNQLGSGSRWGEAILTIEGGETFTVLPDGEVVAGGVDGIPVGDIGGRRTWTACAAGAEPGTDGSGFVEPSDPGGPGELPARERAVAWAEENPLMAGALVVVGIVALARAL